MTAARAFYGALLATLLSFPPSTAGQVTPGFAVTTTANRIDVHGTAASDVHISVLRAAAARYTPERDTLLDMTVATPTPSGWSVITELALRIGIALEVGEIRVAEDGVLIAGTTRDAGQVRRLQERLSAVSLPGMQLESRIIEVSSERTPFSTLCRRQFYALARDNRVRYIARDGRLRSGARGALDRLVELMHDCPDLHVGIVARTEPAAGSVAAYLTAAGIDAVRVRATTRSDDPTEDAGAPQAADRDVVFELLAP